MMGLTSMPMAASRLVLRGSMDPRPGAINQRPRLPLMGNVRFSAAVIDAGPNALEEWGHVKTTPCLAHAGRPPMNLGTILLIILILILLGALPTWPYSTGWGYYPSGGAGLLLIIVIVLLVAGRI
jgi:hypothetical protein